MDSTPRATRPNWFVPWIPRLLMAVGVVLVIVGVFVARDSWSLRAKDTKVTGTIVEIHTDAEGGRSATWEFSYQGDTYQHEGPATATRRTQYEGATDELYIDPDDPDKAKVSGFTGMWLIPTFFIVFGIATFGAGAITWIVLRIVRAFRGEPDAAPAEPLASPISQ